MGDTVRPVGSGPSGNEVAMGGPAGGGDGAASVWSVRAQGDIDVDQAPRLAAQLDGVIDQGARVVLLDLSDASFLDSSGLRAIVRAGDRLAAQDGQLIIDGASGAVSRVLELTGLLEHYADPAAGHD